MVPCVKPIIKSWRIADESWHILFDSQGSLFTKVLTVEPEGCTKIVSRSIRRTTPTLIPHSVYKFSYHFIGVKTSIVIVVKVFKIYIQ